MTPHPPPKTIGKYVPKNFYMGVKNKYIVHEAIQCASVPIIK